MLSISMKLLIRQKIWNLKLFQPLVRGSRGTNKHVGNVYSQLKMRGFKSMLSQGNFQSCPPVCWGSTLI